MTEPSSSSVAPSQAATPFSTPMRQTLATLVLHANRKLASMYPTFTAEIRAMLLRELASFVLRQHAVTVSPGDVVVALRSMHVEWLEGLREGKRGLGEYMQLLDKLYGSGDDALDQLVSELEDAEEGGAAVGETPRSEGNAPPVPMPSALSWASSQQIKSSHSHDRQVSESVESKPLQMSPPRPAPSTTESPSRKKRKSKVKATGTGTTSSSSAQPSDGTVKLHLPPSIKIQTPRWVEKVDEIQSSPTSCTDLSTIDPAHCAGVDVAGLVTAATPHSHPPPSHAPPPGGPAPKPTPATKSIAFTGKSKLTLFKLVRDAMKQRPGVAFDSPDLPWEDFAKAMREKHGQEVTGEQARRRLVKAEKEWRQCLESKDESGGQNWRLLSAIFGDGGDGSNLRKRKREEGEGEGERGARTESMGHGGPSEGFRASPTVVEGSFEMKREVDDNGVDQARPNETGPTAEFHTSVAQSLQSLVEAQQLNASLMDRVLRDNLTFRESVEKKFESLEAHHSDFAGRLERLETRWLESTAEHWRASTKAHDEFRTETVLAVSHSVQSVFEEQCKMLGRLESLESLMQNVSTQLQARSGVDDEFREKTVSAVSESLQPLFQAQKDYLRLCFESLETKLIQHVTEKLHGHYKTEDEFSSGIPRLLEPFFSAHQTRIESRLEGLESNLKKSHMQTYPEAGGEYWNQMVFAVSQSLQPFIEAQQGNMLGRVESLKSDLLQSMTEKLQADNAANEAARLQMIPAISQSLQPSLEAQKSHVVGCFQTFERNLVKFLNNRANDGYRTQTVSVAVHPSPPVPSPQIPSPQVLSPQVPSSQVSTSHVSTSHVQSSQLPPSQLPTSQVPPLQVPPSHVPEPFRESAVDIRQHMQQLSEQEQMQRVALHAGHSRTLNTLPTSQNERVNQLETLKASQEVTAFKQEFYQKFFDGLKQIVVNVDKRQVQFAGVIDRNSQRMETMLEGHRQEMRRIVEAHANFITGVMAASGIRRQ
ncbi:hypothetical protein HDU96_009217 [Phlyctochytrium bullatum]|nr:hypothetical protein HDU96_009217 [Phlyctochytrium bullatum]